LESESRSPVAQLLLSGTPLTGLYEVDVESNGYHDADTFSASFLLSDLPRSYGIAYWAKTSGAQIEVKLGTNSLRSIFVGQVDDVRIDPVDNTISIGGRDLSSRLIETTTEDKHPNLQSHKLVERYAAEHGLKVVAPASSFLVGAHYGDDSSMLLSGRSEWDVLSFLAQQEGRSLFVDRDTLYFIPADKSASNTFVLRFDGSLGAPITNVESVSFGRALTVATDVTVKVRSWHAEDKKAYSKTATAVKKDGRKKSGKSHTYSVVAPNLTPEQAQERAKAVLADITHSEVSLEFAGPAYDDVTVRTQIRVEGTGTGFDQLYWPDTITRRWSWDDGYKWSVTAKNHMAQDTVLG
jgi:phage protein D